MAVVAVAVQEISRSALAPAYTGSLSIANTYTVNNEGKRTFLHFKKTGAGACTVTITTPKVVAGLAVADLTATVPATTGDIMLGPFPTDAFNNGQNIEFTLSEITGLSVAALRV